SSVHRLNSILRFRSYPITRFPDSLRVIELPILAVRRLAWLAAAEVSAGDALAIALMRQQLDEPRLVLHFFVENARRQVIGSRIFAESHVAHRAPTADGATLRLQQQGQDIHHGGRR